jgi:hypothetical protein
MAGTEIILQTHYSQENDAYNGYLGTGTSNPPEGLPTPNEFRVDVPAVPTALTDNRTLTATPVTYDIEIPNDLLEVDFV